MPTEIASLLATAEVETSNAEKDLDNLSAKFDQTSKRVEGVGANLRSTKTALDATGGSARAVHKDFENLTTNGVRGIESLRSTTTAFLSRLSSQIPGVGQLATGLGRDFLRSSNMIANEADRLRAKLTQLAEAEAKIGQSTRNKTADLFNSLKQNPLTNVSNDFLRQYRDTDTSSGRRSMIRNQFDGAMVGTVKEYEAALDKAALSYTKIERNASQAMDSTLAKQKAVRAELAEVEQKVQSTGGAFGQLGPIALGAFLAVGAGVAALVVHTATVGDEIYRVAAKTKFTAETLSVLRIEAKEAGNNFAEFSSALPRFEKNVSQAAEGNKKLIATFAELGVTVGKGASAEEIFKQFLVGFSKVDDESRRAEIAIQLFGRSGANLIPTFDRIGANFEQTAEHARALGAVMGRDAVLAAHNFELRMRDAKLSLEGFILTVGGAALPVITTLFTLITQNIPAIGIAAVAFGALKLASMELTLSMNSLKTVWQGFTALLTSSGGIALLVGLAAALLQWGNSAREVTIITKEQFQAAQQRISQTQQEISLIEKQSEATRGSAASIELERAQRESLLAAKREELRVNQELARAQQQVAISSALAALKDKELNQELLEVAQSNRDFYGSNVDTERVLRETGKAFGESSDKAREATNALKFLQDAAGTNTAKLLEQAKASGADSYQMSELKTALGLAAAGQNNLGFATSSATSIIDAQIKKLQEQRHELQLNASLSNAVIQKNIAEIANMKLSPQAAVAEFKRRVQSDKGEEVASGIPFFKMRLPSLGEAVDTTKRTDAITGAIGDYMNPSKSGGGGRGGAGAAKQELNASLELLKILETATKRSVDIRLNDERYYYESGKLARADYTQAQIRLENEAFANSMRVAREELQTVEDSKVKGKDREVALAKANDKIAELEQRHNARLKEYKRQANQEREAAERESWARSLSLTQEVNSGFEELYQRMADRGVASFTEAGALIAARQREVLVAVLSQAKTALNEFLSKGGDVDTEKYKNLFSSIELAEQKLSNFDSKTLLDGQDNRQRDLERRKQWADGIRSIYQTIEDMERTTTEARLQLLSQSGEHRREIARQQLQFDLEQEQIESKRKIDQLKRQNELTAASKINEDYKRQLIEANNKLIEAEESRSVAKRQQILEGFYQQERERLKAQVDKIVGILHNAIEGLKQEGWKGLFKSLLTDLENFLETAAENLIKSRLMKLLQTINHIPQPGQAGGVSDPSQTSAGGGTAGAGGSIWNWIRGIVGGSLSHQIGAQQGATPSVSITEAGREMTGAIKGAGEESKAGVDAAGKANSGALITVGQGIVSTMLSIASVIANSNSRGNFWSGLFTAAAVGAINGATGQIFSGGGAGGKDTPKTPGGPTQPMKAMGGLLSGPGTGTSDSILAFNRATGRPGAWFSNGEFIMNAEATRRNRPLLEFINSFGYLPARAEGGIIDDSFIRPISHGARTGTYDNRSYNNNFNVTVNGGTGSPQENRRTAHQIAREAARQLQESMRRSN